MSTIREQIITAIVSKAAKIRLINGYNTDCGANVLRAIKLVDPDSLPLIAVWPQPEESAREYGKTANTMPVRIDGLVLFGSDSPSEMSEKMLGDIIENILGIEWTLPFTTGSNKIRSGDTITGVDSSATGYMCDLEVTSGTWAGGDAAGNLTLRRLSGTFQAESITSAVVQGDSISSKSAVESTTNSLAESIIYAGGGTDEYPDDDDISVGVSAMFNIKYITETGNPYSH